MAQTKTAKNLDLCPKCKHKSWRFNIYLHFTAPGRFYGSLGKTQRRHRDVNCQAALWETVSWYCVNPKCGFFTRAPVQVRLVEDR